MQGYQYLLELVILASLQKQYSPLQSNAWIQRDKLLKSCPGNKPLQHIYISSTSKQERQGGRLGSSSLLCLGEAFQNSVYLTCCWNTGLPVEGQPQFQVEDTNSQQLDNVVVSCPDPTPREEWGLGIRPMWWMCITYISRKQPVYMHTI